MDHHQIATLIDLFDQSTLSELKYQGNGLSLCLSRFESYSAATVLPPSPAADSAAVLREDAGPANAEPPAQHPVAAGMAGTFFRRPSPGEPPFAEPGQHVEEGQPIGLVEAMKMLNSIEADRSGRLRHFAVEDGAAVSADTVLAWIETEVDPHV
ncbi:biotin/lipoyl-containing protein [Alcaligenaceae bacterium B3P038]|nr:biotin/lipoyl-containing protein [Alcaligenaceae bacterium B3P038]